MHDKIKINLKLWLGDKILNIMWSESKLKVWFFIQSLSIECSFPCSVILIHLKYICKYISVSATTLHFNMRCMCLALAIVVNWFSCLISMCCFDHISTWSFCCKLQLKKKLNLSVDESMIWWNMQSCCHFIRKRWWWEWDGEYSNGVEARQVLLSFYNN
jgi:hypothetical protein